MSQGEQRANLLNSHGQQNYDSINFQHNNSQFERRGSHGKVQSYINDVYSEQDVEYGLRKGPPTKLIPDYKIDLEAESTTSSHLHRLYGRLDTTSPTEANLMSFRPQGL